MGTLELEFAAISSPKLESVELNPLNSRIQRSLDSVELDQKNQRHLPIEMPQRLAA